MVDGGRRASGAASPDPRAALADALRSAAGVAWPLVRDAVERHLAAGGPWDRRTTRRLAREAASAQRARARAVRMHAGAVARRERVLRSSRRAVPLYGSIAAGTAVAAVPVAGTTGTFLAAVAGTAAIRVALAVRRLRRPPIVPPAPATATAPPPPPHPRSAAFPAVRRLDQVRRDLTALVPLVAPAGQAVAAQAWGAAASADVELRWQAARLAAAEPHVGVDAAVLADLEAGVAAQQGLVQAMADLVVASADPNGAARLIDITDRVHGLAAGLREVRGVRPS